MLTLSENAQAAVKGLTASEELPDTAGLRLAVGPDQTQLEISVVREPQDNDVAVEASEGNVYLAEDAAPLLENQTLDAAQTDEGVGFTLTPQA
ncbi:iron-sulfur cluster biosynthesis family protein [Ornithinimicrobium faecis]|uniref:Fe-S cluster assembly protein HesB n=1 Tax=Ornithinimicrobium faecis TaxID=2934158 RepID=A0ABY4YT07_9MICO|nr:MULTISPECIES: iron-sulfur cluster biosynthesis family protein [unclassified Ornithinimicrobium]USQ79853.1 Fe-S cluster assembly protein HesB [Ornithinimicrobium sp. HY1793]